MDMGAKVPDEHMIPIENLMNPRALDFHAETGFIYFADTTSYLIGRQKIDGTDRETILKDGMCPAFILVKIWLEYVINAAVLSVEWHWGFRVKYVWFASSFIGTMETEYRYICFAYKIGQSVGPRKKLT